MSDPTPKETGPDQTPNERTGKRGMGPRGAFASLVAAIVLGGGGAYLLFGHPPERTADLGGPPVGCILDPPSRIGGPIALTDDAGQRVTQAKFAGSPTLVYFGFTHCPDVCPTSMYLIADAITLLGAQGQPIKTALVTVDPDRDTPEAMHDYVRTEGFPRGLVGLTGNQDEIAAAARTFAVAYGRVQEGDDYTMSHSSLLYVMDGQWRTRAIVPTLNQSPQQVAACVRQALTPPKG